MTTDITELAQRMRTAAEKATPGRIGDRIDGSGSIKYECFDYDGSLVLRTDHKNMEYGFIGDNSLADEEFFRACTPDAIIALVEALEKAQAQSSKWLEAYHKAVSIGARYEERIAELESQVKFPGVMRCNTCGFSRSHVTVKLPDDEDGQAYGFGKWSNRKLPATAGTMTIAYCEDAWRAAFEVFSSAAGIKWEGE